MARSLSSVKAGLVSTWSGIRHFFKPRMTLRYPEQKLDLEGPGYQFDAKLGRARPGFKGRHLLHRGQVHRMPALRHRVRRGRRRHRDAGAGAEHAHNKKNIWPAVDYGRCVFRGSGEPRNPGMTTSWIEADR